MTVSTFRVAIAHRRKPQKITGFDPVFAWLQLVTRADVMHLGNLVDWHVSQAFEIGLNVRHLETAARLKYETIANLKKELEEKEAQLSKSDRAIINNEVTEEHIAQVVSKWTNIPVAKLLSGEREKLMKMEESILRMFSG